MRFMMATRAIHKLGDISRDKPDVCQIFRETETDYIGNWLTGFGFVEVKFPKETTRPLTLKEFEYWRKRKLQIPCGAVIDLPEDAFVVEGKEN